MTSHPYSPVVGSPSRGPALTTVDGVELASWGARAVARVIDNLIALVGTVLLGRLALWVALALVPFGLVVSYLWPLRDARRQTLHDKAGTVVVRR